MFENIHKTLIAWAFNHYVAYYYFDDVTINQLKIAFEEGEIQLENLPIKPDALKHLKLPWDVVSGTVGKLSIRLPITSLLTNPWVIKIDNLKLIVYRRKNASTPARFNAENTDDSIISNESNDTNLIVSTQSREETTLAEFHSSFSSTVSSIVNDIYGNIKLDISSVTFIFDDQRHGITKLSADYLTIHKPENERKLKLDNFSIYLASKNPEDLLKVHISACDLELRDKPTLELNSENDIRGTLQIVGPTNSPIPLGEFLLEDFRMLFYSADQQQDGSIFARVSCLHFNRETSLLDTLMKPWPFNLSWDRRNNYKRFSLISDELAEFTVSSAFLDLVDAVRRRIISESMQSRTNEHICLEGKSLYVLHNETGHRLYYTPVEVNSSDSLSTSPIMSEGGDSMSQTLSSRWSAVDSGDSVQLDAVQSMRIRVDGWKTLTPVPLDRTGRYFREAWSDRVKNEDSHIVVCVDLEDRSARKIITVKSALRLVNNLDATLEIQFSGVDQVLYIKPNSELSVPLQYLSSRMHVRPCNVGVTMSEKPLIWEEISEVYSNESWIHICYPITMTDKRHESYCTSQPYRLCATIKKEQPRNDTETTHLDSLPVYVITFLPPLVIVNLLPNELRYHVSGASGSLSRGSQLKINHVDLTRRAELLFEMEGFPRSKPIIIDLGATRSFQDTLEMFDKNNRCLYLKAKIVLASFGEEPAVQVVVYSPYWFINKTMLPLIIKQEGAATEAAGQYREHEDKPTSIMLFSFYDRDPTSEIEPYYLCSIRLGKSKGNSMWCDGFKLEKGSGRRRIGFLPKTGHSSSKLSRYLIDINIRRGYGRYSDTLVVTLTTRFGFDTLTRTPKKDYETSPQDCKLAYYNYSTNLAKQLAGRSTRQLFPNHIYDGQSEVSFVGPGLRFTLVDSKRDRIVRISFENTVVKCTTKATEQIVDCSIQDIRIENALTGCDKTIVLDRASRDDQSPALRLIMDRIIGRSFGTTWFRQVQISMCELLMNIEERLFLKLVEFISFRTGRTESKGDKELARDLERNLNPDRTSKYYFDMLRIDLSSLKLSVLTSSSLPEPLQRLRSHLKLKFYNFEDAQVNLSPYLKMNVTRTLRGICSSVTRFYKRQFSEKKIQLVVQQIPNLVRFHLSDVLYILYDEVYNKLFYESVN